MRGKTRNPVARRVLSTLQSAEGPFTIECDSPKAAESLRRTLYNALEREGLSASISRNDCTLWVHPKRPQNAKIRPAHAPQ